MRDRKPTLREAAGPTGIRIESPPRAREQQVSCNIARLKPCAPTGTNSQETDMMKRTSSTTLRLAPVWSVGGALALLLAVAAPDPAWADKCVYSDGTSNNGPCVEVRNNLDAFQRLGDSSMNVWCYHGPTYENHKIVLRPPGDSFTCKGRTDRSVWGRIQRTQVGCDTCNIGPLYSCWSGKTVVKLSSGSIGFFCDH